MRAHLLITFACCITWFCAEVHTLPPLSTTELVYKQPPSLFGRPEAFLRSRRSSPPTQSPVLNALEAADSLEADILNATEAALVASSTTLEKRREEKKCEVVCVLIIVALGVILIAKLIQLAIKQFVFMTAEEAIQKIKAKHDEVCSTFQKNVNVMKFHQGMQELIMEQKLQIVIAEEQKKQAAAAKSAADEQAKQEQLRRKQEKKAAGASWQAKEAKSNRISAFIRSNLKPGKLNAEDAAAAVAVETKKTKPDKAIELQAFMEQFKDSNKKAMHAFEKMIDCKADYDPEKNYVAGLESYKEERDEAAKEAIAATIAFATGGVGSEVLEILPSAASASVSATADIWAAGGIDKLKAENYEELLGEGAATATEMLSDGAKGIGKEVLKSVAPVFHWAIALKEIGKTFQAGFEASRDFRKVDRSAHDGEKDFLYQGCQIKGALINVMHDMLVKWSILALHFPRDKEGRLIQKWPVSQEKCEEKASDAGMEQEWIAANCNDSFDLRDNMMQTLGLNGFDMFASCWVYPSTDSNSAMDLPPNQCITNTAWANSKHFEQMAWEGDEVLNQNPHSLYRDKPSKHNVYRDEEDWDHDVEQGNFMKFNWMSKNVKRQCLLPNMQQRIVLKKTTTASTAKADIEQCITDVWPLQVRNANRLWSGFQAQTKDHEFKEKMELQRFESGKWRDEFDTAQASWRYKEVNLNDGEGPVGCKAQSRTFPTAVFPMTRKGNFGSPIRDIRLLSDAQVEKNPDLLKWDPEITGKAAMTSAFTWLEFLKHRKGEDYVNQNDLMTLTKVDFNLNEGCDDMEESKKWKGKRCEANSLYYYKAGAEVSMPRAQLRELQDVVCMELLNCFNKDCRFQHCTIPQSIKDLYNGKPLMLGPSMDDAQEYFDANCNDKRLKDDCLEMMEDEEEYPDEDDDMVTVAIIRL